MTTQPEQLNGASFSTYRIGGPIEEAYQPETLEEAVAVLNAIRPRLSVAGLGTTEFTVLGWGSNSLIASAGIEGVTLVTRKLAFVEPLSDTCIRFGAGVHLAKATKASLDAGLTGGEYMVGIPGTIGGAVRMNAGAMGQDTAAVVQQVLLYNFQTGSLEQWTPEQLGFRYRHSNIDPHYHVVLAADLNFQPGDPAQIRALIDKNMAFRKTHHPTEPNGGSVFRNPIARPDLKVGWMIDQLGGKQWVEGNVRVSPLHGNFIINLGNGTSTEVLRLMWRMKQAIAEAYQVEVIPENLLLGAMTREEHTLWHQLQGGVTIHG
ncbi:MAG: UDP-N-acetylmuramate dehydrogenase [Candidatus Melainabacteria bacterium]|nr:UDP-N-acetylmuramate dehydrogenase [Candidatus Melainabacteria bacterium]